MTTPRETLAFFAKELRRLIQEEPQSKDELKAWDETVQEFQRRVASLDQDILPHFVWHYLADADIRLKDSVYRADQNRKILTIIAAFERGEVPKDV